MYASETEDELPPSARGKPPGTYIKGPLGWTGVICLVAGMAGVIAENISLTGWLISIALLMMGPLLVTLDLNGQIAEPRRELGGGAARRIIEYTVLASVIVVAAAGLFRRDAERAPPRDLSPGYVVRSPPDRPNPGCPVRIWRVGDYVPQACLDRHSISRFAYHIGVETLWTGRRSWDIHPRLWIRMGRDLVGGPCAPHAGCRIATIVTGRFSVGGPSPDPIEAVDFQREPRAYALASAGSLILRLSWPLMIGVVLIESRFVRRVRPPAVAAAATVSG